MTSVAGSAAGERSPYSHVSDRSVPRSGNMSVLHNTPSACTPLDRGNSTPRPRQSSSRGSKNAVTTTSETIRIRPIAAESAGAYGSMRRAATGALVQITVGTDVVEAIDGRRRTRT